MVKTFLLVFFIAAFACCAQTLKKTEIHYPGESLKSDRAELFAPELISTNAFEHSAPTISPDGKTILWSIVELPSWKSRILEINYENGKWSTPHNPSFSDTSANDISPSFSPNQSIVYFSSSRKLVSGKTPAKGNVIWRVEKTTTGWSQPQSLDSTVSRSGDYAPSVAANGNLYFTHGPFRSPDWNILVSRNSGNKKSAPEAVSNINSAGYEDGAFVAPDESYIIFESDRAGGIGGSIDLYISFKQRDGSWTTPVNMGSKVNTEHSERFAKVSPDGKFLFFGSNRRQVDGKNNFDIYWIEASVINELKLTK